MSCIHHVLLDILMGFFDTLEKLSMHQRYVDDTFSVADSQVDVVTRFKLLNSLQTDIKFSTEPVLNVLMMRNTQGS